MIGHREAEVSEALRTIADGRVRAAKGQAAMGGSGDLTLVLNSGSSSVKFALLLPGTGERLMGGIGERLGTPEALLRVQWFPAAAVEERLPGGTHRAVVARVLDHLAEAGHSGAHLLGAGHRVVHGGERFTASIRVDDAVIAAVRSFGHLAPLHNPANLAGIEAVQAVLPDLPQVAVFDTAFHQTMPPRAFRYAVPEEWYTRYGVRRYGFHGISHRFVSEQAAVVLGRPPGELRLVTAHLGNGCSATAVRDGVSVDTTMGLTPLDGLVMGTRSGDVDPGLLGYLAGIEAVRAARPDLPQVAVFDTAFHQTMPPRAFRYAVPEEWFTRYGVRRYGFHGTSHRFVSERAAALLGRPVGELRLVTAHLGNGCSLAAVRDGVSVDTTMGLTTLEGLVMGTRSGDVDPGVFGYLADQAGLTVDQLTGTLNTASGLQGLSGVGNDMRAVESAAAAGDERARLALEVFVHRLAKAVAGMVVGLERLDALVFTGGIGENSAEVRRRVLARLPFLGLAEDPAANARHGRTTGGRISPDGPVLALVVPTDEELMIARDTARLIVNG